MTRPGVGQIRVDATLEELVEQAARNWAAQLGRDVTKRQAAEALIRAGLRHGDEAKKLVP